MGEGRANITPRPHFQTGALVDLRINVHQGGLSIDTTSPAIDPDDVADLIAASAGTQAAFNAAMEAVGGAVDIWYETLSLDHKSEVRQAMKGLGEL